MSFANRANQRRVRSTTPLRKERGVWVFRSGKHVSAADTDHVLREIREERNRRDRDHRH